MKYNKLIPELSVKNLEESREFYKSLGFKEEYFREKNEFIFLSFEGSQIMIEEINDYWSVGKLEHPFGRGINFQIEVKNINNLLKKVKKAKISLFREMTESKYQCKSEIISQKEFLIQDPDGYLLRFVEVQ